MISESSKAHFSVSQFIAVINQTFEYSFNGGVIIVGELANYKISKGKWLYFDLKDENSILRFFGTVYKLPGPLEDGMMLEVAGEPKLHHLYGFSINIQLIQPIGEGSIRRAADLLKAKLTAEGLFDSKRKREISYPPKSIGLIASIQSAAYADFIKILASRWQGVTIEVINVTVQGLTAPNQIIQAIKQFNGQATPLDVLVIIRGGGSAEDLLAFNNESMVRSIAASRIPTLVAVGHEIDVCLAELAADRRASTPSNAAELLVPDRLDFLNRLEKEHKTLLYFYIIERIRQTKRGLDNGRLMLKQLIDGIVIGHNQKIINNSKILEAYNPQAVLKRGYAIVRCNGQVIYRCNDVLDQDRIKVTVSDGTFDAKITSS